MIEPGRATKWRDEKGTQRDKAGNRDLHMDQYCSLILFWFFSPIVDSLRGLQQAGTLDKVRKHFGVGVLRWGRCWRSCGSIPKQAMGRKSHRFHTASFGSCPTL